MRFDSRDFRRRLNNGLWPKNKTTKTYAKTCCPEEEPVMKDFRFRDFVSRKQIDNDAEDVLGKLPDENYG